jgi:hypothetical protein
MPAFPTVGSFPLTSVAKLPNVTIAFPGEHWSNRIAQGAIVPGEAVVPTNYGGKLAVTRAGAGASVARMGIALRTIDVPDNATGSIYYDPLGPNEIRNLQIPDGEYVHTYYSGVFHLTLAVPRAWVPAELVGWNPAGARPTGKAGAGAWDVAGGEDTALFEVMEFRPFSADGHEGILTVRSLRGQF